MASEPRVEEIQSALRRAGVPAWLFYGFKQTDPLALSILGFPEDAHITRRWFYLVPQQGEPLKLVHRIESSTLDHLPGSSRMSLAWEELRAGIAALLSGLDRVAMQYSPDCAIPYVSRIDAGTAELVRRQGVEIVSSADLIQLFESVLSPAQADQHRATALAITGLVQNAFQRVARRIADGGETDEFSVQQAIMEDFASRELETDNPPIVAVNSSSGDPHYSPGRASSRSIGGGDFLLIDLWARPRGAETVFADITWTAFFGKEPPPSILEVFAIVTEARDEGVRFLQRRLSAGDPVQGWEVDDQVRAVIQQAGFGDAFVHRTGHNMARDVHGNGVNFDNLETHDTRRVIEGITCTIEPGIYLPEFGVRSEINVLVGKTGVEVTTPPQEELKVFDL